MPKAEDIAPLTGQILLEVAFLLVTLTILKVRAAGKAGSKDALRSAVRSAVDAKICLTGCQKLYLTSSGV
jgi:hypothetical protein